MSVGSILSQMLLWFTEQLGNSVIAMFQMMMSWWIEIPTPATGDQSGTFVFLREHTGWLTALMATFGLVIAAGRVAIQRKGEPFRRHSPNSSRWSSSYSLWPRQ